MELPFSGGCICRAIRYQCTVRPLVMGNCHCRDCQYSSGTAFSSVIGVSADSLTISGNTLKYYESMAESGEKVYRGFCSECGTPVFAKSGAHPEFMGIKAASLDDPSWFSPNTDIWTDSAQPWHVMNPDTLKFPKELQ